MEKVAIFVDVQNIYYTTRDTFKRPFNYRQFYQDIAKRFDIEGAYAYAIDKGDDQQLKFQSALRHIGFEVKLKPFIQRSDGSAKGDWDVGITIDVLEMAERVEHIILLSGDGDFAILLKKVKQKFNCNTSVYGVLNLSANALISAADEFIDIDQKWLL
ncbi:NYN domain-containing protein [Glaciecola sp. 2405UD65-10]|uniref:LabA-like NYN domain-containing protein n=1 Tax=Glaciecola sp. 2405UD65-10 TaxID=3397244 RepID=UPI003B5AFDE6